MFFPYRTHLEAELIQQREDFTARLNEKDTLIRQLRLELAQIKVDNAGLRLISNPPQVHQKATPAQVESKDWNTELNKMLQEEEDGIRSGRRIQEHEPSADDGA